MVQAVGAKGRLSYVEETTYGTTPGSPSMRQLSAALYGETLGATFDELVSNAINANRSRESVRGGNIAVTGAIPFELPLLGFGTIAKHILGTATSGRDVSQGAGVTNITALWAHSSTPTGAGTLTRSGNNLTWQAATDTTGAAVDVSGLGEFTLESGTANKSLRVRVTSGFGGTSATITVSSTAYKHTIRRGVLPIGMSVEKGFTDIAQYLVFTGCKINQAQIAVTNEGLITGSLDVVGKQMTRSGSSLGTPTVPTHTPFVQHECVLQENAVAANFTGGNITIANALDTGVRYVGSRYIGSLPEGLGECSGDITAVFEDGTYVDKLLNGTATSLKWTFTSIAGSFTIECPQVKYFGDSAPKLAANNGVIVPLNWRATRDAVRNTDIEFVIVNSEATI